MIYIHKMFLKWFATLTNLLFIFILICVLTTSNGTSPVVPWYEDMPAVAMDYKVHIDPGKEDCYFQYVNPGATLYASFQVSLLIFELNLLLFIF